MGGCSALRRAAALFRMKTFERYLFAELLANLLATVSVLGIVVVGRMLSKLLEKVAEGRYPPDVVQPLLIYATLDSLIFLLPFSAMLAVMLTMGRYYRDSEAYAIFSLGIGYARICRVLMQLAVPLTVLLFVLVMEVSPSGERHYEMIKQAGKQRGDITMVTAGRFFSPRDDTVLFVEDYDHDDGTLSGIFIADLSSEHPVLETAAYGRQRRDDGGVKRLHLYNGRRYEGLLGQTNYRVSEYREHSVYLPTQLPQMRRDDPESMSFGELLASPRMKDRAELQWRLATVISVPVLMLLALPLSRAAPRRGRNARIAAALAVFLVYEQLMIFVIGLIGSGGFPPFPGVWWIPAGALLIALLVFMRRRIAYALRLSAVSLR